MKRPPMPLTIRAGGAIEVDVSAELVLHGDAQPPQLLVHGGAVLRKHVLAQQIEQRMEPARHVDGGGAVLSNLGHPL